jgi:hypothetical protein
MQDATKLITFFLKDPFINLNFKFKDSFTDVDFEFKDTFFIK